jgi:hypothetical protein
MIPFLCIITYIILLTYYYTDTEPSTTMRKDPADSPIRGSKRAIASGHQAKAAEAWKFGDMQGTLPIPIGGVVTVAVDAVDRGPVDHRR